MKQKRRRPLRQLNPKGRKTAMRSNRRGGYSFRRDADGCDDLWVVYDEATGTDLAYIPFWDDSSGWMARAAAKAELIVAALNAYAVKTESKAKR